MSDACQELVTSLFQALATNSELSGLLGGPKIFDRLPERVDFPYVVIGRTSATDWSTSTEDGTEIVLFIHAWSQLPNRSELHDIQQHIQNILNGELPPLSGHDLVQLRNQFSEIQRDHARGLVHGLMRYRAVLEPKS